MESNVEQIVPGSAESQSGSGLTTTSFTKSSARSRPLGQWFVDFGKRCFELAKSPPALQRAAFGYALAVFSVAVALGVALLMERYDFRGVEFPLLLFAVALTVWYADVGPGILSVALSSLVFNYFFTEPLHSLYVTRSELPYYIVFLLFASLVAFFAAVRRRVERDLLQSRSELEASNKELEAFAYSVSHDLRAPIRHISGFTELLQKNAASDLNDKSQRHVAMILESAKRMGQLIDDLLAFSRIGRKEAQRTMVSLQQLVQEAQNEVAQETDGRDINWKIGKLPACYGDRSMLRLALVNLISNAVKFTRTRPRAEIEIASANHNPSQIVVFIRDNGVGFDMKYVNKLFGVFQRLHGTEAFEGTGIGLATVQRIVHRHGGRVWAEGLVDGGATFYVSLPQSQGI
jgi:signal transduction histidine kinase